MPFRRSLPDASGNLGPSSAPLQATSYTYDARGNLIQVSQGSQQRLFTYDTLSRLKTARNPEQVNSSSVMVATQYTYDDASNLTTRTNPNGTQVSFTYDGLNRVKTKTLTTGMWTYSYDTVTNGKGRMVSVTKGTEGYFYDGYDAMGRLTQSRQVTNAAAVDQTYTMSYGYDLAGHLISQIYPSGKEYKTSFDNAGRINAVNRYINQAFDKTYASQFQYAPHGGVSQVIFGNNKMREAVQFNSRLQTEHIELYKLSDNSLILGLDYAFGAANNNGNVLSQTIRIGTSATITQSYGYDSLNRLTSAQESVSGSMRWTQTYGYDRYGNRTTLVNTGSEGSLLPTQSTPSVDAGTNRLIGFVYDFSGNVKTDAVGNQFDYDAESRQTSFNNGATTYTYDGEGRRVKKVTGVTTTVFVYNVTGQMVAEYANGSSPSGGTSYLMSDHLRSTRVVTDSEGNVKARHDYLPFGEEIGANISARTTAMMYGAADSTRQRFTGHERDSESGLDFMQARYCSASLGRFTSPDPTLLSVKGENPQSWNRYVYVSNNPLAHIDPLGLWSIWILPLYEKKDGKWVLKEIRVTFIRTLGENGKDDNAETLINQLKLDPNSKQAKFIRAAFAFGARLFRISQINKNSAEAQVYNAIEKILTYIEEHGTPRKGKRIDCSLTACNIGFGVNMANSPGTADLDRMLKGLKGVIVRGFIERDFSAGNVTQDQLKIGDIVRWAKGGKATHFANFIYTNDAGVPVVFSKSGENGDYERATINDIRWSTYDYGSIRGIEKDKTGFYRPHR